MTVHLLKTFEPDISTEMLTHTQTHTHRQTHKQANVICIAKGYPKKRRKEEEEEEEKKETKTRGALLDSACGCCKNIYKALIPNDLILSIKMTH